MIVENLCCQFFFHVRPNGFWRIFSMLLGSRLNGVEKHSVAISLMLRHNLTAVDKTRNMEHSGTSRNIPEHEKIKIFFYEKKK